MLLVLTGSAGAGKTTAAAACRDLPGLAVHDSDEHGVPSEADTAWRHRDLERWVRLAIELQAAGTDLLLSAQTPLGEVLAVPSAGELDAVAVCLLDVADDERRQRLLARDGERWPEATLDAFVNWGRWHRAHAADPTQRPEVITDGGWSQMRWDRWSDWHRGDPRWRVAVIDSSAVPIERTAAAVRDWVAAAQVAR